MVTTRGFVRLIGVDTPESGKCGFDAATGIAKRIAPVGAVIRLTSPKTVRNKPSVALRSELLV